MLNHIVLKTPLGTKGNLRNSSLDKLRMAWISNERCGNVVLAMQIFCWLESQKHSRKNKTSFNYC